MNKQDAVRLFVERDFNNIPLSLVEKAYPELFEKIVQPIQPEICNDDYYPIWGTLFEVNDSFIAEKMREQLKEVQDIGFIILDDFDELDLCLGVGGVGYDFYEAHWTPLYDLLGLHWHKEDSEEE